MHVASDLSAFVYPAKADEAKMFEWRAKVKRKWFRSRLFPTRHLTRRSSQPLADVLSPFMKTRSLQAMLAPASGG
jgi:hypothetical protein